MAKRSFGRRLGRGAWNMINPPDTRTATEKRRDDWAEKKRREHRRQANMRGEFTSPWAKGWAHVVAYYSHVIRNYPLPSTGALAIIGYVWLHDSNTSGKRYGLLAMVIAVLAYLAVVPWLHRLPKALESDGQFTAIMLEPEPWDRPTAQVGEEDVPTNPFPEDTVGHRRVEGWIKWWDRNMRELGLTTQRLDEDYDHEDAINAVLLGIPEEREFQRLTENDDHVPKPLRWTAIKTGLGATVEVELAPGQTPTDWANKVEGIEVQFRAFMAEVHSYREKPGRVYLSLFFADPLGMDLAIQAPKPVDLATMTTPIGVNTRGDEVEVIPSGNAGLLASGTPGSGKTMVVALLLASFLQHPEQVNVTISDFKGAGDFDAFKKPGITVIEDDLDATVLMVARKNAEMAKRLSEMKENYGSANYWHLPPDARPPFEVIVIDEVQDLLATKGRSKEDTMLMTAAEADVTALVKKGRAAGFFTILATQKPTADAIPSAVSTQLVLRISGHQVKAENSVAALGDLPDGKPTPHEHIEENHPGRLIVRGGGVYDLVHGYYLNDHDLEASLAHL